MQDKILRDKKANDPWARMTTRNGFSADEKYRHFKKL